MSCCEGGRFRNLHRHPPHGLREVLRWKLGLKRAGSPLVDPVLIPKRFRAELATVDWKLISRPNRDHIQITWIGHATFLIQVDGLNLLTDPVFGRYCAPFPVWTLRRTVPLPIRLRDLFPIHAVLLSHNHHDHLEGRTVRQLGDKVTWFVPLGNGRWLARWGHNKVREMDWWQEVGYGPVSVTSVPAQHFSGRTLFDRDLALWSGFVVQSRHGNVYFAGDTGYSASFCDIGRRFGPMCASLIPIGAYQPRWFMAPMHISPEEAVQAHRDVRSRLSIGMHWGTFRLTDEPLAEPPIALRNVLAHRNIPESEFRTLRIGETVSV